MSLETFFHFWWVGLMSRGWLTLVDKEKFSPSLPFFSIKLHPLAVTASTPLSIVRSYRCSSIRLCSFFARQSCCCCSRFVCFFLPPAPTPPPPYNLCSMAWGGSTTRGASSRSTPAASPATIQVPSTFTPDQNAQIFELALLKAQADLQKVQAERDAIQARSQLELECLRKESKAQVAAATSVTSAAQAPKPRAQTGGDEEIQGEILPKCQTSPSSLSGSPRRRSWRSSKTSSSESTSTDFATCVASPSRPTKTRNRSGLRMGCWSSETPWGPTRITATTSTRSGQKPSSTTPRSWSRCLGQQSPASRPLSPNFTASSCSSRRSTTGRRPCFRWRSRSTLILSPSNSTTQRSGWSPPTSKGDSA